MCVCVSVCTYVCICMCLCHRLNCDAYLGDVMRSVLMCIFNVD